MSHEPSAVKPRETDPAEPPIRPSGRRPRKPTNASRLVVKRRTLGPIGSLEDFIPFKLAVVANRVSQSIAGLFETKYNLQTPEWRILMALYAYGELAFNEVVEHTSMDKARVSRAQRRLVDLKMISAKNDPNDGRRLLLALTRTGVRRCADILPDAAEREAWFLAALDDEEHRQLDTILDKLMVRSQQLKKPAGASIDEEPNPDASPGANRRRGALPESGD